MESVKTFIVEKYSARKEVRVTNEGEDGNGLRYEQT